MWEMERWEMNRDFLISGYMDIEYDKIYHADEPSYPSFNAELRTTVKTPEIPSPNGLLVVSLTVLVSIGALIRLPL